MIILFVKKIIIFAVVLNAFSLGGLALITKKSESLIIKKFGLEFCDILSFTGQQ